MKTKLKNDLRDLTNLITVSGGEEEAIRYLKPRLEQCCDEVRVTPTGNIVAYKKGSGNGPRLLMNAHMDEIGFMVKAVTADGFLRFEKVGDFSDKMIPARKVWIQTETGRIPGVIGMRAAHLLSPEEAIRAQSARQSYIDVGAGSRQEVWDMGVRPGAKVVIQSDFMELHNPDLVCTRSIDDKLGCALILNLLENLEKEDFAGEFVGTFTTLEETTIAGAFPMYTELKADYIIALDTVPCGDVPDIDTEIELPVRMGGGPVLILAQGDQSVLRYNCIHPGLKRTVKRVAENKKIPLQELVLAGNAYVTEESLSSRAGTPAATIAIPRRYSHAPCEVLNMNDAVATWELLDALVRNNGKADLNFI